MMVTLMSSACAILAAKTCLHCNVQSVGPPRQTRSMQQQPRPRLTSMASPRCIASYWKEWHEQNGDGAPGAGRIKYSSRTSDEDVFPSRRRLASSGEWAMPCLADPFALPADGEERPRTCHRGAASAVAMTSGLGLHWPTWNSSRPLFSATTRFTAPACTMSRAFSKVFSKRK